MPLPTFNYRFNPFTGVFYPAELTEEHTVAYHVEFNAYGIILDEVPQQNSPSTTITAGYTEVPRLTPPSSGQFRVDYQALNHYGMAFIEFNASENGETVTVEYKGLGSTVKGRYELNQLTRVNENLEVGETLTVEGSAALPETQIDAAYINPLLVVTKNNDYFNENSPQVLIDGITEFGEKVTFEKELRHLYLDNPDKSVITALRTLGLNAGAITPVPPGTEDTKTYRSVIFTGENFIISTSAGLYAYDSDGVLIDEVDSFVANVLVTNGEGTVLAIKQSGTNRIIKSTDHGLTWSNLTGLDSEVIHAAAYANSVFVVVGDSYQGWSDDAGDTWSEDTNVNQLWTDVTFFNGYFYSCSTNPVGSVVVVRANGAAGYIATNGLVWADDTEGLNATAEWVGFGVSQGVLVIFSQNNIDEEPNLAKRANGTQFYEADEIGGTTWCSVTVERQDVRLRFIGVADIFGSALLGHREDTGVPESIEPHVYTSDDAFYSLRRVDISSTEFMVGVKLTVAFNGEGLYFVCSYGSRCFFKTKKL